MSAGALRYRVVHETSYAYESPVSLSRQQLHLTPRECPWQTCLAHDIVIEPAPTLLHTRLDYFGNPIRHFTIELPHSTLLVRAESVIEVRARARASAPADSPAWDSVAGALRYAAQPPHLDACTCLFESPYVRVKREFGAYAAPCFAPGRPLLPAVEALMHRIYSEFEYDPKATTVATPVLNILETKRGVCQDFAHLMLSCVRSLGLAARYVSGYLLTEPPPGQPRMVGADASHAWVSVYCPDETGGSWVDFDPTNDLLPGTQHITLAWGRDFGDVSPLRGVILGGDTQVPEVAVTVTPIAEEPAGEAVTGAA